MSVWRESAAGDGVWRPATADRPIAARVRAWLAMAFAGEEDRLILWWPVTLGCGIALYFALADEPQAFVPPTLLALAAGLAAVAWRHGAAARIAAIAGIGLAAGFAGAAWRTAAVEAPVVERRLGPIAVTGVVEQTSARGTARVAITLAPERIGRLGGDRLPRRVRVTASRKVAGAVEPGSRVRLRAVLMPPPEPAAPGAFDFARVAWFARLGAVGYVVSRVETLSGGSSGPAAAADAAIERLRSRIAARIGDVAPGAGGAIAAALLTGDRGAVPESALTVMRDAGLAHLLAISGLHMALVCGTVFFAVRLALALVPWVALRVPAKKLAAAAALAAGLGYYLIAGGSVATERAFIMAAISLLAITLDRAAITMRNVAIAATAVLIARPESLLQPGFQMSFAAVVALVAFYEALRPTLVARREDRVAMRGPAARVAMALAGIAATTVVASLATGPFAAYHFNRVAVFGLVANLAAIPIAGAVVMPLGLVVLAAMPFGLEALPVAAMARATDVIIDIAATVSDWPGAVRLTAAAPPAFLALVALGGLWLCLWRRRWRWLGLAPIAASLALAAQAPAPDLLVSREANAIALRGADGRLAVPWAKPGTYSIETWLRRDGDRRAPGEAAGGPFACDLEACVAPTATGEALAFVRARSALLEECWRADILIAQVPVIGRCPHPRLVIDLFDLNRHGAQAIRFAAGRSLEVVTSAQMRGRRPWAGGARR